MIVSIVDVLNDYNRAIRNAKNASLSIIKFSGKVRKNAKLQILSLKNFRFKISSVSWI